MPFNHNTGVFSLLFNWPSERDEGLFIEAGKMESQQQDIANAINEIVDGTQSMTGTMIIAGGTVSQPAYSFTGDTDTGTYRSSQDSIGVSCGGVKVAEFTPNGFSMTGTMTIAGGTVSQPAYSFTGDTNTGIYQTGQDSIGISCGGVEVAEFTPNGFSLLPAGMIMPFAGQTLPSNWLECDGSAISRTGYSALFSAIGTTYGAGNGSTFNLPDLRGEFVRGWDHGRGIDSGRSFGSYQGHALEEHQHSFEGYSRLSGSDYDMIQTSNKDSSFDSTPVGDVTGATTANETRPRNIALMYCIKV